MTRYPDISPAKATKWLSWKIYVEKIWIKMNKQGLIIEREIANMVMKFISEEYDNYTFIF